jgi:hypothetical protein
MVKMTSGVFRRSRCASVEAALLFFLFPFFFLPATGHAAAIAKGDAPSYAEKGKVVAVRVDEHTDYVPISPPDSKGRTRGGEAFVHRKQVYRVETDDGVYELEGGKNPTMNVGDAVEFRIDGGTAHVRVGERVGERVSEKEKKYRILMTTSKPLPKE